MSKQAAMRQSISVSLECIVVELTTWRAFGVHYSNGCVVQLAKRVVTQSDELVDYIEGKLEHLPGLAYGRYYKALLELAELIEHPCPVWDTQTKKKIRELNERFVPAVMAA